MQSSSVVRIWRGTTLPGRPSPPACGGPDMSEPGRVPARGFRYASGFRSDIAPGAGDVTAPKKIFGGSGGRSRVGQRPAAEGQPGAHPVDVGLAGQLVGDPHDRGADIDVV